MIKKECIADQIKAEQSKKRMQNKDLSEMQRSKEKKLTILSRSKFLKALNEYTLNSHELETGKDKKR